MRKSFRLQLTAWYLGFFALLLVLFSGFLYALLSRSLRQRLDTSLANSAVTAARLFQAEVGEHAGALGPAAEEALTELQLPATSLAIYAGGKLLAASAPEFFRSLKASPVEPPARSYRTIPDFGHHGARMYLLPVHAGSQDGYIAALEPLDSVAEQLQSLRHVFLLALPLALMLAGIGGYLLAAKSLAPVITIAAQAEAITAQNLDRRLQAPGAKAEFARLVAVFNALLARLEQSFAGLREFVADASHELRTPLAIIRGEADVALSRNRPSAEYRESLATIQDEARRLTRLVDDLLNLARADAGHRPLHLEEFYLNDLVEECFRSAQPLARQKSLQFTCTRAGDVSFHGDQELLRRMVLNLLENAIRYTPVGGSVSLTLESDAAQARILVADNGIGIPPEGLERVFDRFYRVDKARSRAGGGFGLGLSIVKWIAESHHGTVHVQSLPAAGSTFTVRLPLAAVAVHRAFMLDSVN